MFDRSPRARLAAPLVLTVALGACDSGPPPEGAFLELGFDTTRVDATVSGMYIKQIEEGAGQPAVDGDAIHILYTGWLTDGTEFDSSFNSDPPRSFPIVMGLGGAIQGFMEGTDGMREGEKRHIAFPPEMGYGEQGTPGGPIPPNAWLVFEVEADRIERPRDPATVTFAPELGVDLASMTLSDTGLYWTTLAEGSGEPTAPGDRMALHYTGWLADGTKFDSSYDSQTGDPLPMVLQETALIEGWTEGVTGMRLGERRRLVLPPGLGYGFRGSAGGIGPNEVLVFEVELAEHEPGN